MKLTITVTKQAATPVAILTRYYLALRSRGWLPARAYRASLASERQEHRSHSYRHTARDILR